MISNPVYDASEIIGKILFSIKPVEILSRPSADSIIGILPENVKIGRVTSYIKINDDIFWTFIDQKNQRFFIKHQPGIFDIQALKDQGSKTFRESEEQKAKKRTDLFQNLGIFLGILVSYITISKLIKTDRNGNTR